MSATNAQKATVSAETDRGDGVMTTLPPSHISQEGFFVHLAPPSDAERIRFFERSVARRGLLEEDLAKTQKEEEKDEPEDDDNKKDEPKIHPLALASARLQSNGINELNRAINLHGLVAAKDYFGLSNIVDPSHEAAKSSAGGSVSTTKAGDASKIAIQKEEDARTKAAYITKRKRVQFNSAATTLDRHCNRLTAAICAQRGPDVRLTELRPVWRLVAPEHGTRALAHAARPTETVAADVDVYYKDPNNSNASQRSQQQSSLGRLASRVPRYATIELSKNYTVEADVKEWKTKHSSILLQKDAVPMEVDDEDTSDNTKRTRTQAEPFAIADPALGKMDADFNSSQVKMLTLQFDIGKSSTGYVQSACLEPISPGSAQEDDEKLLVALQHSLFCAKLFESIRRELAPDTEEIGQVRTSQVQSVVWLSGESEENFLPPPSLMIQSEHSGLVPLCVVHVHEGDVKVFLDREYFLRVRLVESTAENRVHKVTNPLATDSGSQTPEQLLMLCRALLLHAQETHHRHSVQEEASQMDRQKAEEKRLVDLKQGKSRLRALPPVENKESLVSPRILQSCVSLGTKMLFECRIRKTLQNVNEWIKSTTKGESLMVEWLSLSILDLTANFTVCFRSWSTDACIMGDELTLVRFGTEGEYRKAKFNSDKQFEIYLKIALRDTLKRSS